MWSVPKLASLLQRRQAVEPRPSRATLDAQVDEAEQALTTAMLGILRAAGYDVHEHPGARYHERVSVDYGNGLALTSAALALDHYLRGRDQARRESA